MSILLIEMEVGGHHMTSYTRSIVSNLIKNKKKIILLTSHEIKKKEFYLYFKQNTTIFYEKKIKYPTIKSQINFFKFQLNYYNLVKKTFEKIYKKNKIEHVYINNLDFFDKPLSVYGSPFKNVNFSGLYLNPKFYMSFNIFSINFIKKIIYEKLFLRLLHLKDLKNLFFVDPLCFSYLNKIKKNYQKKISFINDLGTANQIKKNDMSKKKCQKFLNIEKNNFVILVYGSIRENKSLNELIKVTALLKKDHNIKIIIAGSQDKETRFFLKRKILSIKPVSKNFIIIDQYISDGMEKIIFKAADVTWLGYSKKFYGSSGVFFLSCQNKVPVIGSNHGVLGWYLKKFNVGFSTDLLNTKSVITILRKLIIKPNKLKYNFVEVNKKHNFQNFGKSIVQKILKKPLS